MIWPTTPIGYFKVIPKNPFDMLRVLPLILSQMPAKYLKICAMKGTSSVLATFKGLPLLSDS